jgi:hypothetical protein
MERCSDRRPSCPAAGRRAEAHTATNSSTSSSTAVEWNAVRIDDPLARPRGVATEAHTTTSTTEWNAVRIDDPLARPRGVVTEVRATAAEGAAIRILDASPANVGSGAAPRLGKAVNPRPECLAVGVAHAHAAERSVVEVHQRLARDLIVDKRAAVGTKADLLEIRGDVLGDPMLRSGHCRSG